jgi:predicted dehydrogenase
VRRFEAGAWSDLAPGVEPHPGAPEPWAAAHVETARRFLALVAGTPHAALGLASLEEGATVQRVLAAAAASEERGQRVALTA